MNWQVSLKERKMTQRGVDSVRRDMDLVLQGLVAIEDPKYKKQTLRMIDSMQKFYADTYDKFSKEKGKKRKNEEEEKSEKQEEGESEKKKKKKKKKPKEGESEKTKKPKEGESEKTKKPKEGEPEKKKKPKAGESKKMKPKEGMVKRTGKKEMPKETSDKATYCPVPCPQGIDGCEVLHMEVVPNEAGSSSDTVILQSGVASGSTIMERDVQTWGRGCAALRHLMWCVVLDAVQRATVLFAKKHCRGCISDGLQPHTVCMRSVVDVWSDNVQVIMTLIQVEAAVESWTEALKKQFGVVLSIPYVEDKFGIPSPKEFLETIWEYYIVDETHWKEDRHWFCCEVRSHLHRRFCDRHCYATADGLGVHCAWVQELMFDDYLRDYVLREYAHTV